MMATANGRRPQRMDRMILALLENSTLEKAAASLGISIATLWRWTQKEEFQEALLKARREAFSKSVARLQHGSSAAVATLLGVMADRTAPHACRVRAADSVLDRGQKAIEIEDLEFRLQRLERTEKARQDEQLKARH
jgi:hypothetical protein